MASSLTHTQTRSVVSNQYRVDDAVTASSTIPGEVFVFKTDDASFSRVASVSDLIDLPTSQVAAQSQNKSYYRLAAVVRDFASLKDANDFANMVKERLKKLCVDYDAAVTLFIGTETLTVSS